jgi:hypothetical protein
VWINGERVKDVVTHPAFKPIVDVRARLYDMAHEAQHRELMSYVEGKSGERCNRALKLPRTVEDWHDKRRAVSSCASATRPSVRSGRSGTARPCSTRSIGNSARTSSNESWGPAAASCRDLVNSDYAGHRVTFELFAQSPPFAHLNAVYTNFDFEPALSFVRKAAGLSDKAR